MIDQICYFFFYILGSNDAIWCAGARLHLGLMSNWLCWVRSLRMVKCGECSRSWSRRPCGALPWSVSFLNLYICSQPSTRPVAADRWCGTQLTRSYETCFTVRLSVCLSVWCLPYNISGKNPWIHERWRAVTATTVPAVTLHPVQPAHHSRFRAEDVSRRHIHTNAYSESCNSLLPTCHRSTHTHTRADKRI